MSYEDLRQREYSVGSNLTRLFDYVCRLELDTDEVAQNLQFERAASGINFAIVISHVEPGSQCEKVNSRPSFQFESKSEQFQ